MKRIVKLIINKTMKEKFLSEYSLYKMSRNSMIFTDNKTGEKVWIHRNIFNNLDKAETYRVVVKDECHVQKWVEGLFWESL